MNNATTNVYSDNEADLGNMSLDEYKEKVVRIMNFGAFVEVSQGKEGMIHISKLSDKRVEKVEDVVKVGDMVQVEVIKVDDKGRVDFKLVAKC